MAEVILPGGGGGEGRNAIGLHCRMSTVGIISDDTCDGCASVCCNDGTVRHRSVSFVGLGFVSSAFRLCSLHGQDAEPPKTGV